MLPQVAAELMPQVVEACGDVPVEFHSHCNNGMAPFNALIAADSGIRYIHAAIPPLANGSSNPSIEGLVHNLQARGHNPMIDVDLIASVSSYFFDIAERDGHPIGAPLEFDASMYTHQIPGGMVSNLRHQLGQMGMGDKLDATFEEAARVRAEFGYPIMITPLSQFVGTQAAMNVITGQRYQQVTDATIQYALGWFGEEAVELMDPDVRREILDRPRTEVFASQERPEPTLDEVRERYGSNISDRDLVLRVCSGLDSEQLLKLQQQDADERLLSKNANALGRLLQAVLQTTSYEKLRIEGDDFLIAVEGGQRSTVA
jgi:oxaloacetate decarboxylase alpha subunit